VASLRPETCLAGIKAGQLDAVYFLIGPDAELKDQIVTALCETIEADLRDFNFDRQHAAESKGDLRQQLWNVLDLARTLPMMVPRRVVVLQGAEKVLAALRESDGGTEEFEAFEAFLEAPEPQATVAFVAGGAPDRRSKAVKLLEKYATVVDCNPLEDAGDAAAWVKAEAAREGIRIESGAVRLLSRLAGSDVARLRAEFERALLFASGDGIITEAAVQEVASAPTSQDTWAMTNALQDRRAGEALRQLAMKIDAGEVPVMILGQLLYFVRTKMRPSAVPAAIDALFRTDLALKTSRGEPRVLLERLIVELCR
jgi:DNA polymerase III delta subunit